MRPCNQCRKPVENRVMICDDCKAYNLEFGLAPKKTIQANTEGDLEPPAVEPNYDRSLGQIANAFYVVLVLLGALIGVVALGGFKGFVVGGIVGFVICVLFLRMVFLGM